VCSRVWFHSIRSSDSYTGGSDIEHPQKMIIEWLTLQSILQQ
jgi:hypothetical protein